MSKGGSSLHEVRPKNLRDIRYETRGPVIRDSRGSKTKSQRLWCLSPSSPFDLKGRTRLRRLSSSNKMSPARPIEPMPGNLSIHVKTPAAIFTRREGESHSTGVRCTRRLRRSTAERVWSAAPARVTLCRGLCLRRLRHHGVPKAGPAYSRRARPQARPFHRRNTWPWTVPQSFFPTAWGRPFFPRRPSHRRGPLGTIKSTKSLYRGTRSTINSTLQLVLALEPGM